MDQPFLSLILVFPTHAPPHFTAKGLGFAIARFRASLKHTRLAEGLDQGSGIEGCGSKSEVEMAFTVEVNHGGYFTPEPFLKYFGGDITLLSEIDIDKWSFFEFVGILKQDVKIKGDFKLCWEGANAGFKELVLDSHVAEVLNFGLSQNSPMEVYVEKLNHGLVDDVNVVDVEEGVGGGIVEPEGAAISDSDSDEGKAQADGEIGSNGVDKHVEGDDEMTEGKVGRSEIYKIKTCRPKHHCGKVFKNKNASSEWVAMLSAEKLRSNNDIKLTQIMDDVIFRYGIAIIGRDPNDQYLPLAFVVVENETENSWKWFLELLVADIGEIDANKPLYTLSVAENAVPEAGNVMPITQSQQAGNDLHNNMVNLLI
ncbi:hypothetical protein HKD37_11G031635 [Glycine soja]